MISIIENFPSQNLKNTSVELLLIYEKITWKIHEAINEIIFVITDKFLHELEISSFFTSFFRRVVTEILY